MKIVINIPEVYYESLKNTEWVISGQRSGKTLQSVIYNAIKNGTPLDDIKAEIAEEIELKSNLGDYNDYVRLGLQSAIEIIDEHIGKETK